MKTKHTEFPEPYLLKLTYEENASFRENITKVNMKNEFQVKIAKNQSETKARVSLSLTVGEREDPNVPFHLFISMATVVSIEKTDEKNNDARLRVEVPKFLLESMRGVVYDVFKSSRFQSYLIPDCSFEES